MRPRVLLAILWTTACGPVIGDGDSASADGTTTDPATTQTNDSPTTISASDTSNPTASTTASPTDPTSVTIDPAETTDSDSGHCGELGCFDLGGFDVDCDPWAQDCEPGHKCVPWANDYTPFYNATRCSPIDPDPVALGEECTPHSTPSFGEDNCDVGSICMFVDDLTHIGVCVAMCTGTANQPFCDDPSTTCAFTSVDTPIACLPACDPLLGDCAIGVCTSENFDFVCSPLVGPGAAIGERCAHPWECAAGGMCTDADLLPACDHDRCCADFCNIEEPDACGELVCDPWLPRGESPGLPPPIGVCVVG